MYKIFKEHKILIIFIGVIILIGSVIVVNSNSPDRRLKEQLALAEKYLEDLDYEQAIAAYMNAIEIDPKCESAYIALAEIYMEQGDLDSAQNILEQASELLETQQISEKLEYMASLREQQYQIENVEKTDNIKLKENVEIESDISEISCEEISTSEEIFDRETTEDKNSEVIEQDGVENRREDIELSTDNNTEEPQVETSQGLFLETGGTWIDETYNYLVTGNYQPVLELLKNKEALEESSAPYEDEVWGGFPGSYRLKTSSGKYVCLRIDEGSVGGYGACIYVCSGHDGSEIVMMGDYMVEYDNYIDFDGSRKEECWWLDETGLHNESGETTTLPEGAVLIAWHV